MNALRNWLADLYRDLRDRRLLPVAGLLAAAIVAVPVALSSGAGSPPPLGAAAAPSGSVSGSSEGQAAVLAEIEGGTVRDWRERLDEFKRQNPFRQQLALPAAGDLDEGLPEVVGETIGIDGVASGQEPVSSGSDSSTASAQETATETITETVVKQRTKLVSHKIKVKVGPVGDLETHKRVEELEILPSNSAPVLVFLGVSENGKRALFLVNSEVTTTGGDGTCLLSDSDCQLLLLKEGEAQALDYAAGGADDGTYRLKLLDIRRLLKSAN